MTSSTREIEMSIGLADQVDAVNRDAVNVYRLLADALHVDKARLSARALHLAESLALRLVEGRTVLCRDLGWSGPGVGFWMPYAPGLIRCSGCVKAVTQRIKGTAQDYRCDDCGRFSRPLHQHSFLIPAMVLDVPEQPFAVGSPAINVSYGLCLRCKTQ